MPRYHFDDFVLSPRQRLLLRGVQEQPLIPRYFDLLVFLVERRHEAVHRRDIFDRVWNDAVVSDSALSQAIRTIRRVLDDDPREPRFIRTVSRHGYRFVFTDVREEEDDGAWPPAVQPTADGAEAEPVRPQPVTTHDPVAELNEARRATSWTAGAAAGAGGGAIAGLAAGALGGLILAMAPGSTAPIVLAPVLAVIGGSCGAIGGAGVGAGVGLGESRRGPGSLAVVTGAAGLGGGLVGAAVQWLSRWALAALVGVEVPVGGSLEGLVIGAAAGLGFGLASRFRGAGSGRILQLASIIGLTCGLAGMALTLAGYPLAGGTIHAIADASSGSRATLAPLGRLIGEPDFGPVSRVILAFGESAVFGLGVGWGLLRRRGITEISHDAHRS